MLINQNKAALIGGTTRQNINRIKKLIPRPLYFIDVKDGVMIDDQHPMWIRQVADWEKAKQPEPRNRDLQKLINATIKVISNEFDEETSSNILNMISQELKD